MIIMESKEKKSSTVKFDVGGTIYRVSRTTLMRFPDTMLYVSASERWNKEDCTEDAIYIDRNGERFQYILDYMRDNEVHLPCSVSKDALLNDFKFYGFMLDSNAIKTTFVNPTHVADELIVWENQRLNSIAELELISKCVELEKKYTELCFALLQHHLLTRKFDIIFVAADFAKYGGFFTHTNLAEYTNSTSSHPTYRKDKILQKCAKKCQISYISAYSHGQYYVKFDILDKERNEYEKDQNQGSKENVYTYPVYEVETVQPVQPVRAARTYYSDSSDSD